MIIKRSSKKGKVKSKTCMCRENHVIIDDRCVLLILDEIYCKTAVIRNERTNHQSVVSSDMQIVTYRCQCRLYCYNVSCKWCTLAKWSDKHNLWNIYMGILLNITVTSNTKGHCIGTCTWVSSHYFAMTHMNNSILFLTLCFLSIKFNNYEVLSLYII